MWARLSFFVWTSKTSFHPSQELECAHSSEQQGYPDTAATTLSRLACDATPQTVLTQTEYPLSSSTRERLLQQHLAQGALTSAALSNLLLHRLDTRLTGFARSIGAHYTSYADDLAFSGNTSVNHIAEGLIPQITAIANSEGLTINHRKTRLMRANPRQYLGGQVINQRPNIRRKDYDKLKAILLNAIRLGAQRQFFSSELERPMRRLRGKIDWITMANPERGARLKQLYDQVSWPEEH